MGFTTATDIFQKREDLLKIKTGVKALDDLIGGGFDCGSVNELFGAARSGKSQICHVLAVTCQVSCIYCKAFKVLISLT